MSKDPLFLISDISSIHGLFVENRPTGPPACGSGRTCNLAEVTARLVVLISGTGTNLAALLDACQDPAYGARVVAVGADRDGIEGLARAEKAEIPTFIRSVKAFPTREDWDRSLTEAIEPYEPDLIISAGFLKITGETFMTAYGDRYINTHNSLLPSFPGIHGPADAFAYGVKVAGATLFLVDRGIDTGAILAQVAVAVLDNDTVDTLTDRIKEAERKQLVDVVGRMVRDGWTVTGRKVTIP
jgi:formyltetrahydrofolate-dependent phosphoribosylglycinamide formyltransferase